MKRFKLRNTIFLTVAVFALTLLLATSVPPDGTYGVKWSTLKLCEREVKLANGQTIKEPVRWRPWRGGPIAYGYEVTLTNGKKIKVWVFPNGTPARWSYWCHGHTFDDDCYNPGGDAVPDILEAGYTKKDSCKNLKKGDVIVYCKGGKSHIRQNPMVMGPSQAKMALIL